MSAHRVLWRHAWQERPSFVRPEVVHRHLSGVRRAVYVYDEQNAATPDNGIIDEHTTTITMNDDEQGLILVGVGFGGETASAGGGIDEHVLTTLVGGWWQLEVNAVAGTGGLHFDAKVFYQAT